MCNTQICFNQLLVLFTQSVLSKDNLYSITDFQLKFEIASPPFDNTVDIGCKNIFAGNSSYIPLCNFYRL